MKNNTVSRPGLLRYDLNAVFDPTDAREVRRLFFDFFFGVSCESESMDSLSAKSSSLPIRVELIVVSGLNNEKFVSRSNSSLLSATLPRSSFSSSDSTN